jgi:hypothetical protein
MAYQKYIPPGEGGAGYPVKKNPLCAVGRRLSIRTQVPDSDLLVNCGDFQLRLASNRGTRIESSVLVQRMYAWRGYKVEAQACATPANSELTLQACFGRRVFGTLTVRNDSMNGLAADALYRDEIDAYRLSGRRITEVTRLAVDPEHGSKEVLGALFHAAYEMCASVHGAHDIFIEVNPRHVAFYRRMLNFRAVGEEKICPRVDAPAMLLQVETAYMREQAGLYGGRAGEVAARSLYPYFCAPATARHMVSRMLAAAARQDAPASAYSISREPSLQGSRAQSLSW